MPATRGKPSAIIVIPERLEQSPALGGLAAAAAPGRDRARQRTCGRRPARTSARPRAAPDVEDRLSVLETAKAVLQITHSPFPPTPPGTTWLRPGAASLHGSRCCFEHGHRRRPAGNSAHPSAPSRTGPAQQDAVMAGGDTPALGGGARVLVQVLSPSRSRRARLSVGWALRPRAWRRNAQANPWHVLARRPSKHQISVR